MATRNKRSIDRDYILTKIRLLLEPWVDDIDELEHVDEQVSLLGELGLDSVSILQLVLGIEKEFNIGINDNELDSEVFLRMGNLIDIIEAKINETN